MKVTAYVDGSYDKNTGVYGYGVVLLNEDGTDADEMLNGFGEDKDGVWNVAGEIEGAMKAIEYAKRKGCDAIHICYDYEGIEAWPTHKWKAKKDITKQYVSFVEEHSKLINITFEKVKAHTGVEFNEAADKLAKDGVKKGIATLTELPQNTSFSFTQNGNNNVQIAAVQSASAPVKAANNGDAVLSLEEEIFLEKFCNPALKTEARAAYISLMKLKGIIK